MTLDHTIVLTNEDVINMQKPIPKDKKIHEMMKSIDERLEQDSQESLEPEHWMKKYIKWKTKMTLNIGLNKN